MQPVLCISSGTMTIKTGEIVPQSHLWRRQKSAKVYSGFQWVTQAAGKELNTLDFHRAQDVVRPWAPIINLQLLDYSNILWERDSENATGSALVTYYKIKKGWKIRDFDLYPVRDLRGVGTRKLTPAKVEYTYYFIIGRARGAHIPILYNI